MAITIYKGSTTDVTVSLKDKKTKEPISLAGFSGATAYFDQAGSDTPLAVTGSLVSADCGKLNFSLTQENTNLLEAGDEESMEVVVDQGTNRTVIQFEGTVSIKERLF